MLLKLGLFLLFLSSVPLYVGTFIVHDTNENRAEILSQNFFDNLRAHPKLAGNRELSESRKGFIRKQVENFLGEVAINRPENNDDLAKRKRSLSDKLLKPKGVHLLTSIVPTGDTIIPVTFPHDIVPFESNGRQYIAALESRDYMDVFSTAMVIFRQENDTYDEVARVPIVNGVKIAVLPLDHATSILVAAENYTSAEDFPKKSAVYQFNSKVDKLRKIQTLDMHHVVDVALWRVHEDIYMMLAHFMSDESGTTTYELDVPIYKWMGRHFDVVQHVRTRGARRIVHFDVEHNDYLGVANFQDNDGNVRTYSEIFKFDYHTERYVSHQKIYTRACVDMEVFEMSEDSVRKEHFLIIGNSFDRDPSTGKIGDEISSILYKYVDDYFVPVEGFVLAELEHWLPVQGPNNEAILLAFCRYEGIKVFQYDGWSFQNIEPKIEMSQIGIKSARMYNDLLVISNKNNDGHLPNIFGLEFVHNKELEDIETSTLGWCKNNLVLMEDFRTDHELSPRKAERADLLDDVASHAFESAAGDSFLTTEEEEAESVKQKLEALSLTLENAMRETSSSSKTIELNLTADEVVFRKDLFLDSLVVTSLNNLSLATILENKIHTGQDLDLEELTIDSVVLMNGSFSIGSINGNDAQSLAHTYDDLVLENLTVTGEVNARSGVTIGGTLNGINITNKNLLLISGDQEITPEANLLSQIKINQLQLKSVNGLNLAQVELWSGQKTLVNSIENLTVNHLLVGGYINDVDIPTLDKHALKTNATEQTITAYYAIERLEAQDLTVVHSNSHSGQFLNDLVPTDQGVHNLSRTSFSMDNLHANQVTVLHRFNNINVSETLELDVLLTDSSQEQYVSGRKTFQNLDTTDPIKIQGRIKSKELEKINRVVSIDQNLTLKGDQIITGDVRIEDLLQARDVLTHDCAMSLNRVQLSGAKLTDAQIKPKLKFVQQLIVDSVDADKINRVDPKNFVVNGHDDQIIRGWKVFHGDLLVNGASRALKIDDVDVDNLEKEVLMVDGDQTVEGKHHVKSVIVDRIDGNQTTFNGQSWDAMVQQITNGTTLDTLTISGDLTAGSLSADQISIGGLINSHNFTEILKDVVKKTDNNVTIQGRTKIEDLTVDNLWLENGSEMMNVDRMTSRLELKGPVTFDEPISIENLEFSEECNGISSANFGKKIDLSERGFAAVPDDVSFDHLTIYGKVILENGLLNGLAVQELQDGTVKIDETHEFEQVTFEDEIVSKTPIRLDGHVENLDLKYVIASNASEEQTIFDELTLSENLTVQGSLKFDGLLNGLNVTKMCDFTVGLRSPEELIIDGNAYFAKGPDVGDINDRSVNYLMKNAWFRNRDAELTGSVEFGNVTFESDVHVQGFVENVSLKILAKNYFSKSKDQNISSTLYFQDQVIFENDLIASEMTQSTGTINGINLEEFVRTALLDDYDQTFENTVYFESCTITEDLQGEFLVNGLSLQTDVMRYDKPNMVIGEKVFGNLSVDNLKMDKNILVQDVDVLEWMQKAVLNNGYFNITGNKTFGNATFEEGLKVFGLINGLRFNNNTVMLKNVPQDITGQKIFEKSVTFKGIKLRGLLNNLDVSDLMNNQAYKNKDNTFENAINFETNLTTNNLVIKTHFQGVNVSELITNVTNLGQLNNMADNYRKLEDAADVIDQSLKNQAFFVQYYTLVQQIPDVENHVKVLCDGVEKLAAMRKNVTTDGMSVVLFGWNQEADRFLEEGEVYASKQLTYMDQVLMGRYFYVEEGNNLGSFIRLSTKERFPVLTMESNSTKFTTSFRMPGITEDTPNICTLFLYEEQCQPRIFCESADGIQLVQMLEENGAYKSAAMEINNVPHLILINRPMDTMHSPISIYSLNSTSPTTNRFYLRQTLYVAEPKSVDGITHKNRHFLAVASGHLRDAMYKGRVMIWTYDVFTGMFIREWQSMELDAPVQVKFAVLPSQELMLYVVSDNPTQPLVVYRYEGIAGFQKRTVASTLSKIQFVNQFTMGAADKRDHFLVAQSSNDIGVVRAIFKGQRIG